MKTCFHCRKEIDIGKPGRGDSCPYCKSDLKVCLNCRFFDEMSYNECSEPSADRVTVKDRSNYCEYFEWREGNADTKVPEDTLKALKDLFKK